MIEKQYRVVSRFVEGSQSHLQHLQWQQDLNLPPDNNDWEEYRRYSSLPQAKAMLTRLNKRSRYDGEVEWRIQEAVVVYDWKFV